MTNSEKTSKSSEYHSGDISQQKRTLQLSDLSQELNQLVESDNSKTDDDCYIIILSLLDQDVDINSVKDDSGLTDFFDNLFCLLCEKSNLDNNPPEYKQIVLKIVNKILNPLFAAIKFNEKNYDNFRFFIDDFPEIILSTGDPAIIEVCLPLFKKFFVKPSSGEIDKDKEKQFIQDLLSLQMIYIEPSKVFKIASLNIEIFEKYKNLYPDDYTSGLVVPSYNSREFLAWFQRLLFDIEKVHNSDLVTVDHNNFNFSYQSNVLEASFVQGDSVFALLYGLKENATNSNHTELTEDPLSSVQLAATKKVSETLQDSLSYFRESLANYLVTIFRKRYPNNNSADLEYKSNQHNLTEQQVLDLVSALHNFIILKVLLPQVSSITRNGEYLSDSAKMPDETQLTNFFECFVAATSNAPTSLFDETARTCFATYAASLIPTATNVPMRSGNR